MPSNSRLPVTSHTHRKHILEHGLLCLPPTPGPEDIALSQSAEQSSLSSLTLPREHQRLRCPEQASSKLKSSLLQQKPPNG